MTITAPSETFSIQPGQTVTFTPSVKATSDNPNAAVVTAFDFRINPNPWNGFLVDGATCSFQVTAPANCNPDNATVTLSLRAFDSNGNQVEDGAISYQIACGQSTEPFNCNLLRGQIFSQGSPIVYEASDIANGAVSFDRVVTSQELAQNITFVDSNRSELLISENTPAGQYSMNITVLNAEGEQCVTEFELIIEDDALTPSDINCNASTMPNGLSFQCGSGQQSIRVGPVVDENGSPVTNATFTTSRGSVISSSHNGNGNYTLIWEPPVTCAGGGSAIITVC